MLNCTVSWQMQRFVLFVLAGRVNPCFLSDLGFVMDVSDTISDKNFDREKQVIQGLVEAFEVKLGGSRAGLVTFSTFAHTRAEIGQYDTAAAFNEIVRGLPKGGVYLFHDAALPCCYGFSLIELTSLITGMRNVQNSRSL